MNTKLLAFPALAAALVVSACSTTSPGPTPPPPPPPPNGTAIVQPVGQSAYVENAYVDVNSQRARVIVDGRDYNFSGGQEVGSYGGITTYAYQSGNPQDLNGAFLLSGNYASAAALANNTSSPSRSIFIVGGQETATMPNQSATYDGQWTLNDSLGNNAAGVFRADANFDAGQIDFLIRDGQNAVPYGQGSGTINGNSFNSSFNTNAQSGIANNNAVNGNFYGPNAAEISGLISGQPGANSTGGLLIGGKRP